MDVDEFEDRASSFLRTTDHPTLGRGYLRCAYRPMVELLDHLTANGSPPTSPRAAAAPSCGP